MCKITAKSSAFLFLIYFTFILLQFTDTSFAQESTKIKYITMEEAISKALSKNHQVKASEFALKKAKWDTKHAWTLLFPVINFDSRYTWIDEQTFAERDFRRYLPPELANQFPQTVFQESYYSAFSLSVPVFNASLLNNLWVANSREDMTQQLDKSTRQQTIFEVISAYLDVLENSKILSLQEEFLNLSKLNYEKAERLYQATRYSENDALRWKVDYQQQKNTVVQSKTNQRSLLLSLSRLINSEIEESTGIDENIPAEIISEKDRLLKSEDEEILKLIELSDEDLINVNAALSAAKSNEETSDLMHRNSYTSFMPTISFSYTYAWRENNTFKLDDYSPKTVMINLRMPIFTGFQNYTSLQSSYYDYKKSQEEFQDQLLSTRLTLTDIANRLINLKTQIELTKINVEFNKNNYRIVEQRRDKGLISNIDYIDAKLNLQNAELENISTEFDFISAMVQLYYLIGKIEQFTL